MSAGQGKNQGMSPGGVSVYSEVGSSPMTFSGEASLGEIPLECIHKGWVRRFQVCELRSARRLAAEFEVKEARRQSSARFFGLTS